MRAAAGTKPEHTLVIPTYNRPEFLARLVGYYRERAPRLNLLVLDSSRPEVAAVNADRLAVLGGPVRHVAFPPTEPMVRKIAQGLGLVTTPFVSLCADDDIVFPAALAEATAFLAANPDYVSAHGLYLNFCLAGTAVHLTSEYSGSGNEAENAGRRIFFLCQHYESLFYAAFRTPDLQAIAQAATALPTLHFQELFQSVAAVIKGKIKRFPTFYGGRQSCGPPEPDRDRRQTYYWFADDPAEMVAHYRAYCREVEAFYRAHATPRLDREALYRVLDLAHAVYFAAGCPPKYFMTRLQDCWPDEPAEAPVQRDLLQDLRPLSGYRRMGHAIAAVNRLRRSLRRRVRLSQAAALAELDRAMQQGSSRLWTCRLPAELEWLAALPEFRRAYGELYSYLDRT